MKNIRRTFVLSAFILLISSFAFLRVLFAVDQKLVDRLDNSSAVFTSLMEMGDQSIPQDLLKNCEAVAIFPRTLNLAWGLGGEYGRGVVLRHDKAKHDWSAPVFYTIGGVTLGPQIGGQAVDIVLLVMNDKGLKSLLSSKTTLGGDAGIALGPVGRNATASTDLGLKAEIYSYSKAKGLYIGLSLKGAVVAPDNTATMSFYGTSYTAKDILIDGKAGHNQYTSKLLNELRKYTPGRMPISLMMTIWVVVLVVGIFLIGCYFLNFRKTA